VVLIWKVLYVLHIDFFPWQLTGSRGFCQLFARCITRYYITAQGLFPGIWRGLQLGTPSGHRNKGQASYNYIKTRCYNARASFGSNFRR
jgi:hypothetical protein